MDVVRVSGVVARGLGQGRTLGYPTINIAYTGKPLAHTRAGVYAARVYVRGGALLGAAVVGGDFVTSATPKLEVHVIDDIVVERYGEAAKVELVNFVSELEKISDIEKLKEKISDDIAAVRNYF